MSDARDILGLAVAFGSSVLFGLYMAPRKLSTLRAIPFLLSMTMGVALTASVAFAVSGGGARADAANALLSGLCGVIWALGTLCFVRGVSRMGLAISATIKNTTAVWGALIGIAIFGEGAHTEPITCVAGSVLIAGAAGCLGAIGGEARGKARASAAGITYSLLASLCYAGYTIPLKVVRGRGVEFVEVVFYMAWGALVTSGVIFAVFDGRFADWRRAGVKSHLWAWVAGVLWTLAVLTMTEAIDLIGLAATWPISNLNTIFAVALGVWVFREIDLSKHGRLLRAGLLMAILGVGLLGLAKALR